MDSSEEPPSFDELNQHPANMLMMALFAYSASKDMLVGNCFEVLRFIEEVESGRFNEIAFDQARKTEYRDLQNHLIRYFHNYLAALKALVEHTRNLMKSELISEAHRLEYQEQVGIRFSDDLSKFMEDFRNYMLHFGIPEISHVCSIPEEEWQVVLDLDKLRSWSKWTARSKGFLATQPSEIRLGWLVGMYQKNVMGMHEWFIQSFSRHYSQRFAEFERLREQFLNPASGE